MNTLIFRTMAPFLTVLMLVFSVFVLLRGHNEPGGGFIGGLIAASAIAHLRHGLRRRRRRAPGAALRTRWSIAGFGLFVCGAVGPGVGALLGVPVHDRPLDLSDVAALEVPLATVDGLRYRRLSRRARRAFRRSLLALEEREGELMETPFAILVGCFFAAAIYLMLSRAHHPHPARRRAARQRRQPAASSPPAGSTRDVAADHRGGCDTLPRAAANPLPQALILTAIVISFSFFAFLLVLAYRA